MLAHGTVPPTSRRLCACTQSEVTMTCAFPQENALNLKEFPKDELELLNAPEVTAQS